MGYDAEYSLVPADITDKTAFYDHVLSSLQGLLALQQNEPRHHWVAALSSVASILYHAFAEFPEFGSENRINWAGFYVSEELYQNSHDVSQDAPTSLLIGPYQGRPGCLRIPLKNKRKGVCATGFLQRKSIIVQNVHEVPGHIACDASTESEFVVPLVYQSVETAYAIGVLDIDCQKAHVWSQEDQDGLEKIVAWLMRPDGVVDWSRAVGQTL